MEGIGNANDPILFRFDWPWRVTEYTVRLPEGGPVSLSLTFRRGDETRRLRFLRPYPLEGTFEGTGDVSEVTVRDIRSHQLESVRIRAEFFGYGLSELWADSVEEESCGRNGSSMWCIRQVA